MGPVDRIPVLADGREVSHLAVRFGAPAGAPLCLLYLHGFGSHQAGEKAEFFRQRALDHGLAFCSFDFQGHGESGGSMDRLTLSRNLADVALARDWLAARGQERLCLVGSSMGGGSALWYSALHPEQVLAGLHIAPAVDLGTGLLAWAGPEGARSWEATGSIRYASDLVTCDLGWCLIEDLRAYEMARLQEVYRTPALLLQGARDDSVPWRAVADFAAGCCADLELHLFAEGDHRLTDRKQRLWELMLDFLRARGLA